MSIGIGNSVRRIGFVCLLLILFFTSSAHATPVQVIAGYIYASEMFHNDTSADLSLSDNRRFTLASPYPFVSAQKLTKSESTFSTFLWTPGGWTANFTFLHEPVSKPVAPDGEVVVPFSMSGTLTACPTAIPDPRTPTFLCVDPNTVDVI